MTYPTNTAGLEVVAWANPQELRIFQNSPNRVAQDINLRKAQDQYATDGLVTAASAQARIAESEAEIERLRRAVDQHSAIADRQKERRVAAEARADRLAGAARSACDLLAERTHGHAARSPGHNARLVLEYALQQEPTT